MRESAVSTIKVLLLKNYLGLPRIEVMVCPASADLLNYEGLHEEDLKDRNPDAFAVSYYTASICKTFIFYITLLSYYIYKF